MSAPRLGGEAAAADALAEDVLEANIEVLSEEGVVAHFGRRHELQLEAGDLVLQGARDGPAVRLGDEGIVFSVGGRPERALEDGSPVVEQDDGLVSEIRDEVRSKGEIAEHVRAQHGPHGLEASHASEPTNYGKH